MSLNVRCEILTIFETPNLLISNANIRPQGEEDGSERCTNANGDVAVVC